jgi:hypothetical protein
VVPVPQSVLVTQTTHVDAGAGRQCGVAVGQFASVMQSTQPAGTFGAVQRTGPPPPLLLPVPLLPVPLLPVPLLPAPLLPVPLLPAPLLPAPLLPAPLLPLPVPLLDPVEGESVPALASPGGVTVESPPHCHMTSGAATANGPRKEIHLMVWRVFMASTGGV